MGGVLRPTVAEVDLSAIANNIIAIKERVAPAQVMAVVKADAYGHGAVPVARVALASGASYLGVALVEEGIELRNHGFLEPILVFSGAFDHQLEEFFQYDLEVTVYTKAIVDALAQLSVNFQKPIRVHVKIDTGMGRVGVSWDKAIEFIGYVRQLPGIILQGIYTHFATADEADKGFANLQFQRFQRILTALREQNIHIPLKHAANSGAILDLPETYLDMVRPGIMMYGYYPSDTTTESVAIRPAMTLKSRVSFIKSVPQNFSVSYGRQYITVRPTRIASIPIGYADGYNRLLSNRAVVTIRGRKFPLVGRVCMDMVMADVGLEHPVEIGDEVILFGRPEDNAMTVKEICQILKTIPYEVTCWVSRRVPRVYV